MTTMPRTNWAAGIMAAALFLGLQAMLDGPSDIEAATDTARAANDAITQARADTLAQADDERRAWAICKGWHAERAQVMRLADTGELVCRRKAVQL